MTGGHEIASSSLAVPTKNSRSKMLNIRVSGVQMFESTEKGCCNSCGVCNVPIMLFPSQTLDKRSPNEGTHCLCELCYSSSMGSYQDTYPNDLVALFHSLVQITHVLLERIDRIDKKIESLENKRLAE
jgi:hypothetical protein